MKQCISKGSEKLYCRLLVNIIKLLLEFCNLFILNKWIAQKADFNSIV